MKYLQKEIFYRITNAKRNVQNFNKHINLTSSS